MARLGSRCKGNRKTRADRILSRLDGYSHPISLHHKISKEEADALHAEGSVYLICHYDGRKRTRVTKMLKGAVFFDFEYTYYPHGTRKSVKTTNAKGVVKGSGV